MIDKPKNDKFKNDAPRMNNGLFIVLWMAGHVAAWSVALLMNRLLTMFGIFIQSELVLGMLMALGTGIPTAIVQTVLVERGLKKSMRGWIPLSILGWTLSGLAFVGLWSSFPMLYQLISFDAYTLLIRMLFVAFFVPGAIVQWLWLRRKVTSAGLWVLAGLAGALLFAIPNLTLFGGYNPEELTGAAIAALLYSGATGATMQYLWTQAREKSKTDAASAQQADETEAERLERLQDTADDALTAPEIRPDVLKANR